MFYVIIVNIYANGYTHETTLIAGSRSGVDYYMEEIKKKVKGRCDPIDVDIRIYKASEYIPVEIEDDFTIKVLDNS